MTAPSGPRSGKHGVVALTATGVNHVRNWNLNWNYALEDRVHSASASGHERFAGVEDWNGSFAGFGGAPPVFPGDEVALKLFCGPSDGVWGHTGKVWVGNAIIDNIAITWNWQPNNSLSWTANFSANGCLTDEEGEYYDTTSQTCLAKMCSLLPYYLDDCTGTGVAYTEWPNVESAVLTISAANIPYINSSTDCCTYRRAGIIDWSLDIVDQEDYLIMDNTDAWSFRLYDTATTYWDLAWGLLSGITNVTVDVETGAIKNKTNNIVMAGRYCCDGTGADLGYIINPGIETKWPVAAV